MLKLNDVKIEYNTPYDILYIKLKDCYDSYVDESSRGVLTNIDYCTNEVVGFDIWGFKKRMKAKEQILLPTELNLEEIYQSLR